MVNVGYNFRKPISNTLRGIHKSLDLLNPPISAIRELIFDDCHDSMGLPRVIDFERQKRLVTPAAVVQELVAFTRLMIADDNAKISHY